MSHTTPHQENIEDQCDCEKKAQIPFLDTLVSLKNGFLDTDLFKKETDRNQYLLPSSCHVKQTTVAIPYSLGLRIVRICSDPINRDLRLSQMKNQLIERGYSKDLVESSIQKARLVPREVALRKVRKKKLNKGPIFAVTHDPRLPALGSSVAKHWRTMTNRNKYLAEVFKKPPLIAYKRQQNLKGLLIRAKVADKKIPYPKRRKLGMKKCGYNCTMCPYVLEGKSININNVDWKINQDLHCKSFNVIYAVLCSKESCKEVYIGETKIFLKFRIDDHRGYVNNLINTATGSHFNQPGHCLGNMKITAIEQIKKKNDSEYRKEREEYFIRKFNTVYKGMNRKY